MRRFQMESGDFTEGKDKRPDQRSSRSPCMAAPPSCESPQSRRERRVVELRPRYIFVRRSRY
jgi:hypothetical protein